MPADKSYLRRFLVAGRTKKSVLSGL
jgi:hypothetical protein